MLIKTFLVAVSHKKIVYDYYYYKFVDQTAHIYVYILYATCSLLVTSHLTNVLIFLATNKREREEQENREEIYT